MTEVKAAWQEGYEAGYAAAQEELDKLAAERDESHRAWKAEAESVTLLLKAISEVRAERDAAVADLKELVQWLNLCYACRHKGTYEVCESCNKKSEHWDWRGLSLESKTSDKEEEHENHEK